jgi:hypothetical protein
MDQNDSPEKKTDIDEELRKLYRENLAREADTGGFDFWKKEFGPEIDAAERLRFIQEAAPEVQRRMAAGDTTLPSYMKVDPNVRQALQSKDVTTDQYKTLANYFGNQWIAGEAEDPASLTRRDYIERPRSGYDFATFLASRSQQHGATSDARQRLTDLMAPYMNAQGMPAEKVYTGGESNDYGYIVTNPLTGQREFAYNSGPLGPTGEGIYRTTFANHQGTIGDPERSRYAVGLDYRINPETGYAQLVNPYVEGYQERRRNNAFPIAALATLGGMALFPGTGITNMISRGALSTAAQAATKGMAKGGEVKKRAAGSPEEGEIAEQMTVGTLPKDQEARAPKVPVTTEEFIRSKQTRSQGPSISATPQNPFFGNLAKILKAREETQKGMNSPTATLMDLLLPQSETVEKWSYGDPLFRMPPSGTGGYVPVTTRDKGYVAETIGYAPIGLPAKAVGAGMMLTPPIGAIKPKGGAFPKAGTGSGIDTYLDRVQENLSREAGDLTIGDIKTINQFIQEKGRKYLTSTFGTGDDPLREALLEGRLPTFGVDKKNFREYLLKAARDGNPEAVEDLEKLYDVKSGIGQFLVTPSDWNQAAPMKDKAAREMLDKIKKEGVEDIRISEPFIRKTDIESMLKDYSPDYLKDLAKNLMNRQLGMDRPVDVTDETLIRAAEKGEVFYDLPSTPSLDFLDPKNLAKSLSTLNPDKLSNMSFPEAVIQGTKNTKLQRDWDEVIKRVEDNKTVPKEMFNIGTEKFKPMGEDNWVRLNTAQAVQLEGAAMHHSIGGYAKKGNYGVGGLDALLSGKAQLFSLRGPDNIPRVTIEAQKMDNGELIVKQVKGNFNGLPSDRDKEIVVEFLKGLPINKIQPESYARTITGEDLPERVYIDWSDLAGFGARSVF